MVHLAARLLTGRNENFVRRTELLPRACVLPRFYTMSMKLLNGCLIVKQKCYLHLEIQKTLFPWPYFLLNIVVSAGQTFYYLSGLMLPSR